MRRRQVFLQSVRLFLTQRAADVGAAVFDKDDTLAVEFVASAANLRSAAYGIPTQTLFAAKARRPLARPGGMLVACPDAPAPPPQDMVTGCRPCGSRLDARWTGRAPYEDSTLFVYSRSGFRAASRAKRRSGGGGHAVPVRRARTRRDGARCARAGHGRQHHPCDRHDERDRGRAHRGGGAEGARAPAGGVQGARRAARHHRPTAFLV